MKILYPDPQFAVRVSLRGYSHHKQQHGKGGGGGGGMVGIGKYKEVSSGVVDMIITAFNFFLSSHFLVIINYYYYYYYCCY